MKGSSGHHLLAEFPFRPHWYVVHSRHGDSAPLDVRLLCSLQLLRAEVPMGSRCQGPAVEGSNTQGGHLPFPQGVSCLLELKTDLQQLSDELQLSQVGAMRRYSRNLPDLSKPSAS